MKSFENSGQADNETFAHVLNLHDHGHRAHYKGCRKCICCWSNGRLLLEAGLWYKEENEMGLGILLDKHRPGSPKCSADCLCEDCILIGCLVKERLHVLIGLQRVRTAKRVTKNLKK